MSPFRSNSPPTPPQQTHHVSEALSADLISSAQVNGVIDQMDFLLSKSEGSTPGTGPHKGRSSTSKGSRRPSSSSRTSRSIGSSSSSVAGEEVTGYTDMGKVPLRLRVQWLLEVEGDEGQALGQVRGFRLNFMLMVVWGLTDSHC